MLWIWPDLGSTASIPLPRDGHPTILLKLYIYGYLNRVHSSRRLEREAGRNVEVMWLLARLAPDHKTIADFRKDNGSGSKKVCARFVAICREMGLLAKASVAIDGRKFKAVNNRDKNYTRGKIDRRRPHQGRRLVAALHNVSAICLHGAADEHSAAQQRVSGVTD